MALITLAVLLVLIGGDFVGWAAEGLQEMKA